MCLAAVVIGVCVCVCGLLLQQLHKKENFLTMMSVLSGLQHSSIMRLRKTYDKVEKKTMRVS